jgi:hypothetical protein
LIKFIFIYFKILFFLNFKIKIFKLFYQSAEKGYITQDWEIANVTMIPKKQVKSETPKDYRPISVTSCLGKLMEKLIRTRLNEYLTKNNLIIHQQSGFKKQRQTKDNLFHMIQKSIESFNRKKKVCAIFFDIAAAFDKVWHEGLLNKLLNMKVPMYLISWIKDFLSNRCFMVKVGTASSKMFIIRAGVPQGAVLSPILFTIYINDIPCNYEKNSKYSLLFADDLVSYFIFKNPESVEKIVNLYLRLLETWLSKWRLVMAPQKCNYIIFSTNKKIQQTKLKLKMHGECISYNNSPTFLGLRLDPFLSFKNQINYLSVSCQKRLNCIKILSHKSWKLTQSTLTQIYKSLVRSMVEYSSTVLSSLSKSRYRKLQAIQNTALRSIYKLPFDTSTAYIGLLTGVDEIKDRFNKLNENFIKRALLNANPLICDSYKEYLLYAESRNLKFNTIYCEHKNILKDIYTLI